MGRILADKWFLTQAFSSNYEEQLAKLLWFFPYLSVQTASMGSWSCGLLCQLWILGAREQLKAACSPRGISWEGCCSIFLSCSDDPGLDNLDIADLAHTSVLPWSNVQLCCLSYPQPSIINQWHICSSFSGASLFREAVKASFLWRLALWRPCYFIR